MEILSEKMKTGDKPTVFMIDPRALVVLKYLKYKM